MLHCSENNIILYHSGLFATIWRPSLGIFHHFCNFVAGFKAFVMFVSNAPALYHHLVFQIENVEPEGAQHIQ